MRTSGAAPYPKIRKCSAAPSARRGFSLPISHLGNGGAEDGLSVRFGTSSAMTPFSRPCPSRAALPLEKSRLSTNQANQFRIRSYARQSRVAIRGANQPLETQNPPRRRAGVPAKPGNIEVLAVPRLPENYGVLWQRRWGATLISLRSSTNSVRASSRGEATHSSPFSVSVPAATRTWASGL